MDASGSPAARRRRDEARIGELRCRCLRLAPTGDGPDWTNRRTGRRDWRRSRPRVADEPLAEQGASGLLSGAPVSDASARRDENRSDRVIAGATGVVRTGLNRASNNEVINDADRSGRRLLTEVDPARAINTAHTAIENHNATSRQKQTQRQKQKQKPKQNQRRATHSKSLIISSSSAVLVLAHLVRTRNSLVDAYLRDDTATVAEHLNASEAHLSLRPASVVTDNNNRPRPLEATATTVSAATGIRSHVNGQPLTAAATTAAIVDGTIDKLNWFDMVLVVLLITLILVSIVGNCLVCVAIFTDRRLRKLGNAFIVSLAIADLFVSGLVMTFALCNDLMNRWIFGEWFCDVWISFDIMCCTASILNLCAISLDRFIHIKDCMFYNQWMTRRIAISAVIIIWIISALVSFVPINLGWHKPASTPSHAQVRRPSAHLSIGQHSIYSGASSFSALHSRSFIGGGGGGVGGGNGSRSSEAGGLGPRTSRRERAIRSAELGARGPIRVDRFELGRPGAIDRLSADQAGVGGAGEVNKPRRGQDKEVIRERKTRAGGRAGGGNHNNNNKKQLPPERGGSGGKNEREHYLGGLEAASDADADAEAEAYAESPLQSQSVLTASGGGHVEAGADEFDGIPVEDNSTRQLHRNRPGNSNGGGGGGGGGGGSGSGTDEGHSGLHEHASDATRASDGTGLDSNKQRAASASDWIDRRQDRSKLSYGRAYASRSGTRSLSESSSAGPTQGSGRFSSPTIENQSTRVVLSPVGSSSGSSEPIGHYAVGERADCARAAGLQTRSQCAIGQRHTQAAADLVSGQTTGNGSNGRRQQWRGRTVRALSQSSREAGDSTAALVNWSRAAAGQFDQVESILTPLRPLAPSHLISPPTRLSGRAREQTSSSPHRSAGGGDPGARPRGLGGGGTGAGAGRGSVHGGLVEPDQLNELSGSRASEPASQVRPRAAERAPAEANNNNNNNSNNNSGRQHGYTPKLNGNALTLSSRSAPDYIALADVSGTGGTGSRIKRQSYLKGDKSAPPGAGPAGRSGEDSEQEEAAAQDERMGLSESASAASEPPQCMLTLTPPYAVISSTISFYIPCIIMLGLYSKLFFCARKHVRNIQAVSKLMQPMQPVGPAAAKSTATATDITNTNANTNSDETGAPGTVTHSNAPNNNTGRSALDKPHRSDRDPDPNPNPNPDPAQRPTPLSPQVPGPRKLMRTWIKFKRKRGRRESTADDNGSDAAAGLVARGQQRQTRADPRAVRVGADDRLPVAPHVSVERRRAEQEPKGCSSAGATQSHRQPSCENEPFLSAAATTDGLCASSLSPSTCVNKETRTRRADAVAGIANISAATQSDSVSLKSFASFKFGLGAKTGSNSQAGHQSGGSVRLLHLNNIAKFATGSQSSMQQQQQQQQHSGQLATHKAAITLGIIMGTFLFCWVPFFCLNIIKAFCVDCIPSSMFRAFTWLGYANSALNPIIYGIHNSEFRHAFNRIFFRHLRFKNGRKYLNRRASYDFRQRDNIAGNNRPTNPANTHLSSFERNRSARNNGNSRPLVRASLYRSRVADNDNDNDNNNNNDYNNNIATNYGGGQPAASSNDETIDNNRPRGDIGKQVAVAADGDRDNRIRVNSGCSGGGTGERRGDTTAPAPASVPATTTATTTATLAPDAIVEIEVDDDDRQAASELPKRTSQETSASTTATTLHTACSAGTATTTLD